MDTSSHDGDREGVTGVARAAHRAGAALRAQTPDQRSALLVAIADALGDPARREILLAENAADVADGEIALRRGELGEALVRRLVLTPEKLDGLADGLRQLAAMPDIVGRITVRRELDDGLELCRQTVPLGLLGVVFEARPDAVPQITGLCLKTGNAVILKGGREATRSNDAMVALLRDVAEAHGIPREAIGLVHAREEVDALLELDDLIDLIVARGSTAFVRHVMDRTRIPVMGHAEGLCHLVLHTAADPAMAARIAVDAKTSYPAACNAIETLLWEPGAHAALDATVTALRSAGVELRGCPETVARHRDIAPAQPADWDTEYGALVLSIRQVADLDAAVAHIERHGSKHTETIITADPAAAERFLTAVDAAGVFHNASSRFADGYRYGLGAEVGISTGKLHARGPVGIEGLVTYRWLLRGNGHVSTDYGPGKRPLRHRDLDP